MDVSVYDRRIIDDDLDELMGGLSAIALEGPKGVGKTRTASERARTVFELDDPQVLAVVQAEPARLLEGARPILIDEWQRYPPAWDLIRRADDAGAPAGSFLLTGSAVPDPPPTHSGAARILSLRMRPLSLAERLGGATVSLADLLRGTRPPVAGETPVGLTVYTEEVIRSGLPRLRTLRGRAHRMQLDSYLARVVDRDIPDDAGLKIRNPAALQRWMAAYAAATATVTSWEKIRDAASAGHEHKPAKETAIAYRDALAKIWMLDDLEAWIPANNPLNQLGYAPKHELADPAFAARLLGVSTSALLDGEPAGPIIPRDGTLLGGLFEALVGLSVKVYAAHNEAKVGHLRTARGRQEIDLIVERDDGRVVAIEVKLTHVPDDDDLKHLHWLKDKIGDQLLDSIVVTTGPTAYRRKDGVAVVPAALLGP